MNLERNAHPPTSAPEEPSGSDGDSPSTVVASNPTPEASEGNKRNNQIKGMGSVAQDDGSIKVSRNTTQNEEMTAPGDTSPHTASTDALAGSTEVPVTGMEQRQPHETNRENR